MFVQSANRTETGDQKLKSQVGCSAANNDQWDKIRTNDRQKEIRHRHIAGSDAARRSCRMVKIVTQPAKTRIVQQAAMGAILNDIMADGYQDERDHRKAEADTRRSHEGDTKPFAEPHRRQQDEYLVKQHSWQETRIGEPITVAQLEAPQRASAVAPGKAQTHRVKHDHVSGPDDQRKREQIQQYQIMGQRHRNSHIVRRFLLCRIAAAIKLSRPPKS
jgi:hypothetical protein